MAFPALPTPRSARRLVPHCLLALALLAFGAGLALVMLDRQEQRLFDALVNEARTARPELKDSSPEDALNLMRAVHARLQGVHLPLSPSSTLNSRLHITSSQEQLTNPVGRCASYSQVLAKALMTAGYQVRKVGLAKGDVRATHHVIETRIGSSWVLLDAFYNLAFRAPDGHLASAAEVSQAWATYRVQVPAGYNPEYNYQGFYYTNWDRIPVVGWIVRSSPALARWLHKSGLSIRFWIFNTYRWQAGLCFALSAGCWLLRRRWQRGTAV